MRRKISVGLIVFLLALLESSFFNFFGLWQIRLDLLLLLPIFYGLENGPAAGLGVGLWSGFWQEVFSYSANGFSLFYFSLLGLVCGWLGQRIYHESLSVRGILVFISEVIFFSFNLFFRRSELSAAVIIFFGQVAMPLLLFPAFFWLLKRQNISFAKHRRTIFSWVWLRKILQRE
jgi:rod shape-determining protein MreD